MPNLPNEASADVRNVAAIGSGLHLQESEEIDLRRMLERASGYREDVVEDRWVIETRHRGRAWEVIVEPDEHRRLLVVVTAYPMWGMRR